jgi:sulfoxide reductase heme-binding subunit YedZ
VIAACLGVCWTRDSTRSGSSQPRLAILSLVTAVADRVAWKAADTRRSDGIPLDQFSLWVFRALLLIPFLLMTPEIVSGILGRPGAIDNLAESTADVLGTSSMLLFLLMLTVSPIHTVTGWTWHLPLRRDYGVAMFLTATLDLALAAITTGDTFPGGVLGRIGGRSFLLMGTVAVFLTIPVALTATRRSHRWLGSYWKRLHRLIYVVWAILMLHLLLLFGFRGVFIQASIASTALLALRIPPLRKWWSAARRTHQHRIQRAAVALVLTAVFVVGVKPMFEELAIKGHQAFIQQPVDD